MNRVRTAKLLGVCALAMVGCGIIVNGDELGEDDGVAADLAEYADLVEALEDDREQALDADATRITTAGPWLAWVDGDQIGLRRYPDRYELSLPAAELYRVHTDAALTVSVGADSLGLRGYALPTGELLAEAPLPSPGSVGAAVAVALASAEPGPAGVEAWIVVDEAVWRWSLDVEAPTLAGDLGDAGASVTALAAVELVGPAGAPTLVIEADERVWAVDVAAWTAELVAEVDALLAVGERGLLYRRGPGLYLRELDGSVSVRIDEAIAATGYALNPTFASVHEYTGDGASLAGDRVVYIGSAGLFAFALDVDGPAAITPVLLEPRWDVAAGIPRIEYREPRVVGATAVVRGLIGEAGEVGESGPVYAAPAG